MFQICLYTFLHLLPGLLNDADDMRRMAAFDLHHRGGNTAATGAFQALALHRPHPQDVHAAGAAAGADLLTEQLAVGGLPTLRRGM